MRTLCLYCLTTAYILFCQNFARANGDTSNTQIEQTELVRTKILLTEKISFIRPAPTWFAYPQEYGLMTGEYEESSRNKDGIFCQGRADLSGIKIQNQKNLLLRGQADYLFRLTQINRRVCTRSMKESIYRADWETYQSAQISSPPFSVSAIMPAAVGTAVGFFIVDAIVAADKGKIYLFDQVADDSFN